MTVPKRRSHNKCIRAVQQALGMNSRGRAQTVFFMALFVAAVLFLNNITHLPDILPVPLPTHDGVPSSSSAAKAAAAVVAGEQVNTPPEPPKVAVPLPAVEDTTNKESSAAVGGGAQEKQDTEPAPMVDESGLVGDAKETTDVTLTEVGGGAEGDVENTPAAETESGEGAGKEDAGDGLSRREQYALFKADMGILSDTPFETFLAKHKEIDEFDNTQRCRRYGYSFTQSLNRNRRIFYGAVMQDEPWELFEILSAESYGIFEAMVFIEPDKDIYGQAREPLRLQATDLLKSMFGVDKVKVIKYSNDDDNIKGDLLHDLAREEIVTAWKELGMTVDDVGYMSSIDDIFARDYLKAIQHCELPEMKYELHHCLYNRVKVFGNCQVYETSPDCVSRTKKYIHPDMMIGACIKGIGDESFHRIAPRDDTGIYREEGWNCEDRSKEKDIKDQKFPLWTATDMRQLCGGRQANLRAAMHQQYTAFHFRNFYNTARDIRLKYTTEEELYDKSLDDLGEDMRVTYRCIKEIEDEKYAVTKREPGGFKVLKPMTPLYFADEKYRDAAHERAKKKILDDEKNVKTETKKETKKAAPAAAAAETKQETKKVTKKVTKKETKTEPKKDTKKDTKAETKKDPKKELKKETTAGKKMTTTKKK